MRYLLSHWQGQQGLWRAVAVNLLLVWVVLRFLEPRLLAALPLSPDQRIRASWVSLLISCGGIYAWQLIGTLRAIETDFIDNKAILRTRGLQAIALLSVALTQVYALGVLQNAYIFKRNTTLHSTPKPPPGYHLTIGARGEQLHLSGVIEIGITRKVEALLNTHPKVKSVVLESSGGQIYEGRGLAKQFMARRLDTLVWKECSSACTLAFIGGQSRYLAQTARLGFHRYQLDRSSHRKIVPFYDLEQEQLRDQALYRSRGVATHFLQKMYQTDAAGIWYPPHSLLLEAGVASEVITSYTPTSDTTELPASGR